MLGKVRILGLVVFIGLCSLAMSGCAGEENSLGEAGAACSSLQDCAEGEVCELVNGVMGCVAAECGCTGCAVCPEGTVCTSNTPPGGICVASCLDDSQCAVGTVCNNGLCELPTTLRCPETACGDNEVCDEDSGACVPAGVDASWLCQGCTNSSECGGDTDLCSPLSSGSHCTSACTDQADCPVGYTCYAVTNEGSQCVPFSYKCEGCVVDGCGAGETCNYATGACMAPLPTCGGCNFDYECSADGSAVCHQLADGSKSCAPACGDGGACPENSTCTQTASGSSVCAFNGSSCCYGPDCAGCDCSGNTPQCLDGECVQCLKDADCPTGTGPCDMNTHSCQGMGSCQDPTPFLWQGACVECLNSTHCTSGACDVNTHSCTGDACSVCQDPYPACAEIAGQVTCVQCTPEDKSYCTAIGGTDCDPNTYTCIGGNPGNLGGSSCSSAADCPPSPFDGAPMECANGYCYDKSGACDGITAMCPFGGDCVQGLGDLLGGMGGGLPGGGGGTSPVAPAAGACSCDPANSGSDCMPGTTCLDMNGDPLTLLMCALGGDGDISALLSAAGGPVCIACGAGGGLGGLPFP